MTRGEAPSYSHGVARLFEMAFARLDHAAAKQVDFAKAWEAYADTHPWNVNLVDIDGQMFELVVSVSLPAPPALALAFSDWLSSLRAALDNGLYAWAAEISGCDPPPDADKLQFPIARTPSEYRRQSKRLRSLPDDVVERLEIAQPYQSPFGIESNLLYWLHELARVDRHRTLHVGLGRVAEHHVRIGYPEGVLIAFDESVDPYDFIDPQLAIARFTMSSPVEAALIRFNPGIGIDPEIREWEKFRLDGEKTSLFDRMFYMQVFMRNHIENMAHAAGVIPNGGFRTFDPDEPADL